MKKTPLKRGNSQLKKVPLKKTSSMGIKRKTPDPKYLADKRVTREKDIEFYNMLWNKKLHICEACGTKIYGENSTAYHHHCLEKGIDRFAHLRYEEENLMLICIDCHYTCTNGFPHPKIKEKTEQLLLKFDL